MQNQTKSSLIFKRSLFTFLLILITVPTAFTKSISFMTYNLENLFDTKHDKGKEDYTYLPIEMKQSAEVKEYCKKQANYYWRKECFELDWSEKILDMKLSQLARVILSANDGDGPDFVVVEEVENKSVLRMLVDGPLRGYGYNTVVLVEGDDKRGIDVGIIAKYPLHGKAKLHSVKNPSRMDKPLRGILEATFSVNGEKITIFGNHWPSQGNTDDTREACAKKLQKLAKAALSKGSAILATGDFNTLRDDHPHGINRHLLNKKSKPYFYDMQKLNYQVSEEVKKLGEEGTHWYRGKWSFLDKIFLLSDTAIYGPKTRCARKKTCLKPNLEAFKVIKHSFMLHDITINNNGNDVRYRDVPFRFNKKKGEGYSDHLPLYMEFEVI